MNIITRKTLLLLVLFVLGCSSSDNPTNSGTDNTNYSTGNTKLPRVGSTFDVRHVERDSVPTIRMEIVETGLTVQGRKNVSKVRTRDGFFYIAYDTTGDMAIKGFEDDTAWIPMPIATRQKVELPPHKVSTNGTNYTTVDWAVFPYRERSVWLNGKPLDCYQFEVFMDRKEYDRDDNLISVDVNIAFYTWSQELGFWTDIGWPRDDDSQYQLVGYTLK